jgi:glutaredoxin
MFCQTEKAWLSQRGVQFEERDVARDPQALAELERLDVYSTPATVIDSQVVVGFSRKKLAEVLGMAAA